MGRKEFLGAPKWILVPAVYDVLVLGGGPAGYVAALRMIKEGLKVAVVEKKFLGGECTNWGCIPSKALIEASHASHLPSVSRVAGVNLELKSVDSRRLMSWVRRVVLRCREGVRYLLSEADIIEGVGRLKSRNEVIVEGTEGRRVIEGKNILVATGSDPASIPGVSVDGVRVISNREFFELSELPSSILIVGAGVIGVELGQALARLGVEVHIVEILERPLPTFDEDVSQVIARYLRKYGIDLMLSSVLKSIDERNGELVARIVKKEGGEAKEVKVDKVLLAVGRKLNSSGIGLEEVGVEVTSKGAVVVDEFMRTSIPNVYAAGDVVGSPFLAHKASREGLIAAEVIAKGKTELPREPVPSVVFSDPEIGMVGLDETQAKLRGVRYEVVKFPYSALSRDYTRLTRTPEGFAKLLVEEGTKKILGAVVVGNGASEVIHTLAVAVASNLTAGDLEKVIMSHPTYSELVSELAHATASKPLHLGRNKFR